jgi:alginate O-acetyltransferase complex protein AlgI
MTAAFQRIRPAALLIGAVVFVFWLQPATAVRGFDFWLPFMSIALTALVWAATQQTIDRAALLRDAGLIVAVVLAIALTRYVPALSTVITRARPPDLWLVLPAVLVAAACCVLAYRGRSARVWAGLFVLLIVMLIVIKFEPLTVAVSAGLRGLTGQRAAQAGVLDWRWLGFSYLAFRWLGTLRERTAGKLPALSLAEFATFALFPPVLLAGPIDRADRFVKDLRAPYVLGSTVVFEAGQRLLIGAFKKFVIADALAWVALSDANAASLRPGWAWLVLYAYAFRLFFDFAGYTDMALGAARLLGIRLPENFNNPYLKPNLTQFWNSWHISLSQWFRAYWFNPLTRALRARELPMWLTVLLCQGSTMTLIGLWHGVTPNFLLWGVWHALGLFVHNRWADVARTRLVWVSERPALQRAVNVAGVVFTFHFVALGWVWFALRDTTAALGVFRVLLGWP